MRYPLTESGYTLGLIAIPLVALFLLLFNAYRMGKFSKQNILCMLISVLIMILLPWCAVRFAQGGGMAVCFVLFFVINPILSIGVGIFSGMNIKQAWFQPLLCAILYVLGTWLFLEMGETVFVMYAGIYLALGYIATVISWLFSKRKK